MATYLRRAVSEDGYAVEEVRDGDEALALALREDFDAIDQSQCENFVAVVMMRLRKKVDAEFAVKLIRTERGIGYRIATQRR